jgi:hypothetical protein
LEATTPVADTQLRVSSGGATTLVCGDALGHRQATGNLIANAIA